MLWFEKIQKDSFRWEADQDPQLLVERVRNLEEEALAEGHEGPAGNVGAARILAEYLPNASQDEQERMAGMVGQLVDSAIAAVGQASEGPPSPGAVHKPSDALPVLNSMLLGEILIQLGIATPAQVNAGLRLQAEKRIPIGQALIALGIATQADLEAASNLQAHLRGDAPTPPKQAEEKKAPAPLGPHPAAPPPLPYPPAAPPGAFVPGYPYLPPHAYPQGVGPYAYPAPGAPQGYPQAPGFPAQQPHPGAPYPQPNGEPMQQQPVQQQPVPQQPVPQQPMPQQPVQQQPVQQQPVQQQPVQQQPVQQQPVQQQPEQSQPVEQPEPTSAKPSSKKRSRAPQMPPMMMDLGPMPAPKKIVEDNTLRKVHDLLLGQVMVREGIVTEEQLAQALKHQVAKNRRIGHAVVELKFATIDDVERALKRQRALEEEAKATGED